MAAARKLSITVAKGQDAVQKRLILPQQGKGFIWDVPLLFSGEKTFRTPRWKKPEVGDSWHYLETPQGNPIKAESWLEPPAVTNTI